MTELRVVMFDGFEVRRGAAATPVRFARRKAKALFALLARNPGKRHPRESLAAMLWPGNAEPNALGECERLFPGYLESRKGWRSDADAARNERFFAGQRRHRLLD